jgi:outer membrane immunogenic protein
MHKLSVAVFSLLLGSSLANAADMPDVVVAPRALWSWTGLYFGGHVGAGFGTLSEELSAQMGFSRPHEAARRSVLMKAGSA